MLGMKNIPKLCLYIKHLKLNSFSAISHTLDPNIFKIVSIGLHSCSVRPNKLPRKYFIRYNFAKSGKEEAVVTGME